MFVDIRERTPSLLWEESELEEEIPKLLSNVHDISEGEQGAEYLKKVRLGVYPLKVSLAYHPVYAKGLLADGESGKVPYPKALVLFPDHTHLTTRLHPDGGVGVLQAPLSFSLFPDEEMMGVDGYEINMLYKLECFEGIKVPGFLKATGTVFDKQHPLVEDKEYILFPSNPRIIAATSISFVTSKNL